jgi:restriction system protein
MNKILLVRSPESLIKQNLAGYGWGEINFSDFSQFNELLTYVKEHPIDIGRHKNQMSRFFNIKEGDIVVVPVYRAIILGIAQGVKSHGEGVKYGENRVSVNYFKDADGNAIKIPRSTLKTQLQSRLKIRMTVTSLNEFKEDILSYVEQLKNNNQVCFDSEFLRKKDEIEATFKKQLLENLRSGNTFLESGGYGLEKLVLELMTLEGYSASISAKNQFADKADIDIEASRTDPVSSNKVFIQVKHHTGNTSKWGIEQLVAVNDDEDEQTDKCLVTTGELTESVKKFAAQDGINVKLIDGSKLVDWIYVHIGQLSPSTKEKLGVTFIPQFII